MICAALLGVTWRHFVGICAVLLLGDLILTWGIQQYIILEVWFALPLPSG